MTHAEIRLADDRLRTKLDWLDSKHSFSFADQYEPENTHFGLLLVNNDDVVAPRKGFTAHPHRDMEIVTWVLSGALEHRDSQGRTGVVRPGLAQRMTAGRGIRHAEHNASSSDPVRFVQMWLPPDELGLDPGYEQAEIPEAELTGRFAVVASGMSKHQGQAAVTIASSHAALHVARLTPGAAVALPDAPFTHLFVATGTALLGSVGALAAGDAVRLQSAGALAVTATAPAEILVWEMDLDLEGLR